MFKKYVALLCVILMVVGCFGLIGCGSDGDKASWNGTYYGRTIGEESKQEYTDTEVVVDDGYMTVSIVKHFVNSEGKPDTIKIEGEFEDGDDGKAIVIVFKEDMYNAELRKLAGKYYLSIKDSNDGDVDEKYEVEKNAKKQPEISMSQVPTTKKVETTKVKETKAKKTKKTKKKSSSVSSDFKKTMDDYEDFIDDYVAFMKKYKKASAVDQASMLTDYSDMMSKYSDLSSEMANMKSDLSSDELAYYTKVMTRVTKKLAKVQ